MSEVSKYQSVTAVPELHNFYSYTGGDLVRMTHADFQKISPQCGAELYHAFQELIRSQWFGKY